MMGWSVAFENARKVEEEGRKLVIDINKKKRKIVDNDNEKGDDDDDDDENEEGGFSQPNKLAKFLRSLGNIHNNDNNNNDNNNNDNNNNDDNNNDKKQLDNINRQICRIWLKNKYLGSDIACNEKACMRKHSIDLSTDNLGRLY